MPNQEVMREWVSRLRSGNYRQGQGHLNSAGRFCCLGVLCEIATEQGVVSDVHDQKYRQTVSLGNGHILSAVADDCVSYDGATQMPPARVYKWSGIEVGPIFGEDYGKLNARTLANMNDEGASFSHLADRIEEAWIELPEGTEVPDSPAAITTTAQETVNA